MTSVRAPDFVIVGGGVIGCGIAYFLAAEHRASCLVVERDAVGSGASGGAAGELGAVGRHRYSERFTRFLLDGIRMHEQMAPALVEESGVDYRFSEIPLLRPAFDEGEAEELRGQMGWQQGLGIGVEWLDAGQVRELGTWLSPEAVGAAYTVERQLEAYPFAIALAQAAERRGVEIRTAEAVDVLREGDRAVGVALADGERVGAGAVIVANGPWSRHTGGWLGMDVPVEPLRGQIVHMSPPAGAPMPSHAIFHETGYLLPKAGGDLLAGTTQELAGFDARPTQEAQDGILEAVSRLAPQTLDAPIRDLTACLRPLSADEMPILGAAPGSEGLYVATGHGYKGVTLALATGKSMAELAALGESEADIGEFSPSRFFSEG